MNQEILSSSGFSFLQPNDVVDIIAPASRGNNEDLEKISPFLAAWNLKARIPKDIFGANVFCANSDEIRFQLLKDALTNNETKAIWCVRGGYGSMRLIPYLSKITPPAQPKMLIGSSDITALHIFLQNKWGWPSIHGPSATSAILNQVSPDSLEILKSIIFRTRHSVTFDQIIPLNQAAENTATIIAPMIGGNLSLIQASLGTSWQIQTSNKIIFIEEVNERGYRIDRMLEQLKQAQIFEPAKAILFGDMLEGKEPNGESFVKEAIQMFADSCELPVLQISGIGHGFVNNPLLLGVPVTLKLGVNTSLSFNF